MPVTMNAKAKNPAIAEAIGPPIFKPIAPQKTTKNDTENIIAMIFIISSMRSHIILLLFMRLLLLPELPRESP